MAVGDIIDRDDYNNIQTIVQRVLGTGTTNSGYGQPVLSSPVATGQKVTVQEWDNIRNDIINISRHQNGTIPTLPSAAENAKIRFDSNTEVWEKLYTEIQNLENTRFNIAVGNFGSTDLSPAPFTSLWKNSLTSLITLTWDSVDNARFYFNSGGKIAISSTRSGGTTTGGTTTIRQQNENWSSVLTSAGTTIWGGNLPLTGLSPNNGRNYYRLLESFQTIVSETGSSPYQLNEFRISVRQQLAGRRVQFFVEWIDGHVFDTVGPDGVDGILTLNVGTVDPIFNLVPASNTANVIQTPTATVSAISGT